MNGSILPFIFDFFRRIEFPLNFFFSVSKIGIEDSKLLMIFLSNFLVFIYLFIFFRGKDRKG